MPSMSEPGDANGPYAAATWHRRFATCPGSGQAFWDTRPLPTGRPSHVPSCARRRENDGHHGCDRRSGLLQGSGMCAGPGHGARPSVVACKAENASRKHARPRGGAAARCWTSTGPATVVWSRKQSDDRGRLWTVAAGESQISPRQLPRPNWLQDEVVAPQRSRCQIGN